MSGVVGCGVCVGGGGGGKPGGITQQQQQHMRGQHVHYGRAWHSTYSKRQLRGCSTLSSTASSFPFPCTSAAASHQASKPCATEPPYPASCAPTSPPTPPQKNPTWVVFKHADCVSVHIDLAAALEECCCIKVCCSHWAVHTLHQLTHTGTNAPVTVQVHSVGLGQVLSTIGCGQQQQQ